MPDTLEELALSGVLFQTSDEPGSRPRTPVSRTPSPNTDDELFGSSSSRPPSPNPNAATHAPSESIGMGPGRTGVKGVIRDRNEARDRERTLKDERVKELRQQMERTAITAKSYREEQAENEAKDDERGDGILGRGVKRTMHFQGGWDDQSDANFGHLREVGARGFVAAVEEVDRDVWVVVHLYHPVNRPSSWPLAQAVFLMVDIMRFEECGKMQRARCGTFRPGASAHTDEIYASASRRARVCKTIRRTGR